MQFLIDAVNEIHTTHNNGGHSVPHVVTAVTAYLRSRSVSVESPLPCKDEALSFFNCLDEESSQCFTTILNTIDENDTCMSLSATSGTFCSNVAACMANAPPDCLVAVNALGTCSSNDPSYLCPGLCVKAGEILDGDASF